MIYVYLPSVFPTVNLRELNEVELVIEVVPLLILLRLLCRWLNLALLGQIKFLRRVLASNVRLAEFRMGSLVASNLVGVRLALLEGLPVVVALLDNVLHKGGVLVVLASDSVGTVTFDDLVVDEPVVEGLAEAGAVLVEVFDGYERSAGEWNIGRNKLTIDVLSQGVLNVDGNDFPVRGLVLQPVSHLFPERNEPTYVDHGKTT